MRTHTVRSTRAIAIARPRADGAMGIAVLAVTLTTAALSLAILAMGWEIGGLILRVLGA